MTSALSDFLLARIAEDEAVARAAVDSPTFTDAAGRWTLVYYNHEGYSPNPPDGSEPDPHDLEWATHASRHDPARVLAECAAKRQVVAQYVFTTEPRGLLDRMTFPAARAALEIVLGVLASAYAEHPNYRQEWKQ